MKTILIIIITILITAISFAQNGINYKAVIKDDNGNILANQDVTMQFTILEDVTEVYSELHSPTTNENGLIIVTIGEGAIVFGSYSGINWGVNNHYLKVEIADGMGGAINLGTTKFNTVPYALNAANVSGLEALNEGNGIGHRIIGKNPSTAGPIGVNAVDLSQSPINSETYGATGANSAALNRQTTAQGQNSTAMGLDSKAYGNTSTVMGFNTVTNGYDAVAMGAYTVADAVQSVAIGRYNIGGGHNQIWNPVEPVFEIGNGTNNSNRSNALTVLKNGTITAPSLTNSLIDIGGNKALISKEYLDNRISIISLNDLSNAKTVGLTNYYIGNNAGSLNTNGELANIGIGLNALRNGVSGFGNIAIGYLAMESNQTGGNNLAAGVRSLRFNTTGYGNTAIGSYSLENTTTGYQNVAVGHDALKSNTTASLNTAVGTYSLIDNTTGTGNTAMGNFALGNNTSGNSNVAIGWGALSLVTTGNNNIGIGNGAEVPNAAGNNQVKIGTSGTNYAGVQVAWTITSDKRWKDNIRELPYGLDMISKLRPVDYVRKNNDKKTREAGFIAQEVQQLLKDLNYDNQGMLTIADNGYMSLRYNDFIPVLVKAIQEQQEEIKKLQSIVNSQQSIIKGQDSKIESLTAEFDQRLKQIETILKTLDQ